MSHSGIIIGIPGLKVESIYNHDGIEVYAKPKGRPHCVHCDGDNVTIKATHKRTVKAYKSNKHYIYPCMEPNISYSHHIFQ